MSRIIVTVPDFLAEELVAEGLAEAVSSRRSGMWQILGTYATGAATAVSVLQGPQTVSYIARRLKEHFCKTAPHSPSPAGAAQFEVVGPGGSMTISLEHVTVKEFDDLLTKTVFPQVSDMK